MAEACRTSARPSPFTSARRGELKNIRSFICAGKPGGYVPVRRVPDAEMVLAEELLLGQHDVEQPAEAGRAHREAQPRADSPNAPPPSEAIAGPSVAALLNSAGFEAMVR